jgi:hypothetical protein
LQKCSSGLSRTQLTHSWEIIHRVGGGGGTFPSLEKFFLQREILLGLDLMNFLQEVGMFCINSGKFVVLGPFGYHQEKF